MVSVNKEYNVEQYYDTEQKLTFANVINDLIKIITNLYIPLLDSHKDI